MSAAPTHSESRSDRAGAGPAQPVTHSQRSQMEHHDQSDGAAAAAPPPSVVSAKEHYNRAAGGSRGRPPSTQEWKQRRKEGPTAALKKYHNSIKRYMINTLAARAHPRGARSLLDLACGRGGDIDKWIDARIPDVHGIDISEEEVRMASSRFEKKRGKNRRLDPDYTFEASDLLGEAPMKWNREFDLVTCMFAGHYFLQTEKMLDAFLGNVSAALRDGGFYFGTIASGRAVLELLRKRDMASASAQRRTVCFWAGSPLTYERLRYESPLLRVRRAWPGDFESFGSFGSGYTFALGDTITNADVTAGEVVDDGAVEFLTFFGAYTQLAERHGLVPDPTFVWDPNIGGRPGAGLEAGPAGGKYEAFRVFRPEYDPSDPQSAELTKASLLYAAFVFVKKAELLRPAKRPREDPS